MNKLGAIVACLILIIGLGGFDYAYMSKVNAFNQTKRDLVSLGYDISNNVSGVAVSTFIRSETVVPIVDFASFVSIARHNKVTTIRWLNGNQNSVHEAARDANEAHAFQC